MATLASAFDLAGRLSSVAPGEVVKVPVGVDGEDEVPHGEGEKVDQHPEDVGEAVGGDDDEDAGEAEDEEEEDEGDGWGRCVGYGCFDAEGDCEGVLVDVLLGRCGV